MSLDSAQRIRLDFAGLPLMEVAVRVSLESPVDLKFAIINEVYDQLRDRFGVLTEPTGFERPPGIGEAAVAVGPGQITGAVYSGNPDGLIITLQSQVIVARWLRKVGEESATYPRFPALRDALWRAVNAFEDAAGGRFSRIAVTNMSYVNFLRIPHSAAVLARYFSARAQVETTAGAKQIHKVEVAWREADSVDLRYNLEQITAKVADQTVEGYRLTTAAGIRLAAAAEATSALDSIHDKLQVFFRNLISGEAREEWQLTEVPLE